MPTKSLTQWNQRLTKATLTQSDGSMIKKKDPERYNTILKAIKEGLAHDSIVKIFGIGQQTIDGIIEREQLSSISQTNVLQEIRSTRNLALSKLRHAIQTDQVKGDKLSVTVGILTDKEAQLMGQPSQVIRHEKVDLTHEAVQNLLSQLPKKADVIDVEPVGEKDRPA